MQEIQKKQEEERKRLEAIQKEAQRQKEENDAKQKAINELAKKYKIDVQTLDNIMDVSLDVAKAEGILAGGGLLLWLGGVALTCICPVAGPIIASGGLATSIGGGIVSTVAGTTAGISKIIKDNQ